jgi:hypothetical protein
MRLRVTPLRSAGRPLERRDALAAPGVVGELLVHYATDPRTGRPVKQALLVDAAHALRRELLAPLHGPELLSAAQLGLVLRGTELASGGVEYVQEWWCRWPDP